MAREKFEQMQIAKLEKVNDQPDDVIATKFLDRKQRRKANAEAIKKAQ